MIYFRCKRISPPKTTAMPLLPATTAEIHLVKIEKTHLLKKVISQITPIDKSCHGWDVTVRICYGTNQDLCCSVHIAKRKDFEFLPSNCSGLNLTEPSSLSAAINVSYKSSNFCNPFCC